MHIDRVIFPVLALGYGQRMGIWTIGCPRRCLNCSNPELQEVDKKKNISIDRIMSMITPHKDKIDGITITGGDPFFQKEELLRLVKRLKSEVTEDIIVYTGYTIEELKDKKDPEIDSILDTIAALIDGPYVDKLNDNKGIRGSSNQRIHILNKKYKNFYKTAWECERKVQNIFYGNNSIYIGIPLKDSRSKFRKELTLRGIRLEAEKEM